MASDSIPPKEAPNWLELPRDITENIFHRLDAIEVFTNTRNVCSLWWKICMDPLMWRTVDMSSNRYIWFSPFFTSTRQLEKTCRYAVQKIGGHLEAISIAYFATDDLLKVIASCASQLRRLELEVGQGDEISDAGLLTILDGCPLLESLYLRSSFFVDQISASLLVRCKEHIKDFRIYNDSGGYYWDLDFLCALFSVVKKS